ncbi:MAG: hypothetical protein P8O16_18935 [Algoriphagus sp.]|uniref:hypothetical protein n=1 Tax=Algoriphagus sp. TaxID=1872435 RepID=UPI0026141231|nr:hypothetical protein [Algoriphagus sp.]MDG1279361.1 hypothetical protein [Algoriphagus sp.]
MKYLFTSIILIFSVLNASAQEFESKVPSQSIYVELGGAGLPYSFNYDFRFDKSKIEGWGMRVGLGGYTTTNESFFSAPIMVNRLFGKGVHFFEIGLGATFFAYDDKYNYTYCADGTFGPNGEFICNSYSSYEDNYSFILDVDGSPSVMGTMNFGYRRIPKDGGFTWKVNLNPIFNNNGFWPLFAGVGFGYAF